MGELPTAWRAARSFHPFFSSQIFEQTRESEKTKEAHFIY